MANATETPGRRVPRKVLWIASLMLVLVAGALLWLLLAPEPTAADRVEDLDGVASVDRMESGGIHTVRLIADAGTEDIAEVAETEGVAEGASFTVAFDTPEGVGERRVLMSDPAETEGLARVAQATAELPGSFDLTTSWYGTDRSAWIEADAADDGTGDHPGAAGEALGVLSEAIAADDMLGDSVQQIKAGVEFRACEDFGEDRWATAREQMAGLVTVLEDEEDLSVSGWAGDCEPMSLEASVARDRMPQVWSTLHEHLPGSSVTMKDERFSLTGQVDDDPTAGLDLAGDLEDAGARVEEVGATAERVVLAGGEESDVREVLDGMEAETQVTWTQRSSVYDADAAESVTRTVGWSGLAGDLELTDNVRQITESADCSFSADSAKRILWWFAADCRDLLEDPGERAQLFDALRSEDDRGAQQNFVFANGLGDFIEFSWEPGEEAANMDVGDKTTVDSDELISAFNDNADR